MDINTITQQEQLLKYKQEHKLRIEFQGNRGSANVFSLDGPARLVVDLKANLNSSLREMHVGNRLIKRIRFGQFTKDSVRIVYDLERYLATDQLELRWGDSLEIVFDLLMVDLFDHKENVRRELLIGEYLEGVVAAEMPASFSLESLVAQAVVARTYTLKRMRIFGGTGYKEDYDLTSDSGVHQGWWSVDERVKRWGDKYSQYQEKLRRAVRLGGNQYLTFNGQLIDSVYHSTCGGQSASSEEVWGSSVPYLVSVDCEYCQGSPYFRYLSSVSVLEIKPKDGRPKSVILLGKEYPVTEFRKDFNLPSAWVAGGNIEIETRGFGHGVGLCQWGAEGQAREGKNFRDILLKYYKGVKLEGEVLEEMSLVVVDPGHGGRDPGAVGLRLKEKDVNLAVSLKIQRLLLDAGVPVVLTRDNDKWLSLEERVVLANQKKAGVFVSVHCNGAASVMANGTETYHYPGSQEGKKIADCVHLCLIRILKRRDRGIKTANFAVLRQTNMPAILVELAFITNEGEERLLGEGEFQQRAAQAISEGIISYLKKETGRASG